jgi:hypothetical protein
MNTKITPEALIEMGKLKPLPGQTIVVWFSCGAASAVAAKKTIELYGKTNIIRIVNNPIKEEHEDNQRFLKDVEAWLGLPIEFAINSKYKSLSCVDVWEDENMMAANKFAPCTQKLKKEARYEWEVKNRSDWTVLGFTKEEKNRFDRFQLKERPASLWILSNISKAECFEIILGAGIKLPEVYNLGYPNANCIGCVKASSPTYWNHVRNVHPEVFKERSEQSRQIGTNGCKLVRVKGKRIFLDQLLPTDKGRSMKNMQNECGIFCNTK